MTTTNAPTISQGQQLPALPPLTRAQALAIAVLVAAEFNDGRYGRPQYALVTAESTFRGALRREMENPLEPGA